MRLVSLKLVLIALMVILTASGRQSRATTDAETDPAVALGYEAAETPGPAPALAFVDGAGKALSLADFKGRVVLLNLWATWCPPCVREMPALDRLQAELGGPDFEVVALSIDRAPALVARFFDDHAITALKRYIDPKRRAHVAMGATGLPFTALIDRRGRILGRVPGPAEWDGPAARALIASALGAGAAVADEAGPSPVTARAAWIAAGVAAVGLMAFVVLRRRRHG